VLGQALKAFVVLEAESTLTEAALLRECQAHLESFKVPKQLVFVPALPKTSTGKIKKTELT